MCWRNAHAAAKPVYSGGMLLVVQREYQYDAGSLVGVTDDLDTAKRWCVEDRDDDVGRAVYEPGASIGWRTDAAGHHMSVTDDGMPDHGWYSITPADLNVRLPCE